MPIEEREVEVRVPRAFLPLFEPKRYKVYYGGRGSAKSHCFARALLVLGMQKPLRILCAREYQRSIADSVHKLLKDLINDYDLGFHYEVLQTTIRGRNGTEFIFAGLHHNIASVKSVERIDICWVEEAQTVSKASWDVLIPTIRADDSEIWVSFNPDLEDDDTYQRFVIHTPTHCLLKKVSYEDNPYFPAVLEQERLDCLKRDPVGYRNIWLGECKQAVEGAIFANELEKAKEQQRITRVTLQAGVPVQTFWDLGQSDNTAIWFVQLVGMEYRLVDYFQASGEKMPYYIDVLAKRGYLYGEHWLPHDADHEQIAAHATIKQQMQQALRDNPALGKGVNIVPRVPHKALGIDAARGIFERCVFDSEKTKDGLQCLRRYRYARDEQTGKVSKEPVHDQWSHGADAFMQLAQHARRPAQAKKQQQHRNLKKYV